MKTALKYLHHKCIDSNSRWYPLLGIYYLTHQCNFHCPYCSNGRGTPYHELSPGINSSREVALRILEKIRSYVDHLVITGGEPLEHPAAESILKELGTFNFKTISLNTNGFKLDTFLPAIASNLSTLIVSLDTLNETKADAWSGLGSGTLQKILANIKKAASYPGRKYHIMISSVITPKNMDDLYEVYRYTADNGFFLAVCPALQGRIPHPKLIENDSYQRLLTFLIQEKKKGGKIFGSINYLQHMQAFKAFTCHPFSILAVNPSGDILYPCLEIGHHAGSILENESLHLLRHQAEQKYGPAPKCQDCCYSACALGFSLAIEHPWKEVSSRLFGFTNI